MAGGLLGTLLGSSPPLDAEVQAALAELHELERARPSLAGHAAWLREVLPALSQHRDSISPPAVDPASAANQLADGIPLLRQAPPASNGKLAQRVWLQVCEAAVHCQPSDAAQALARAVRSGQLKAEDCLHLLLTDPSVRAGSVSDGAPTGGVELAARADALGLDAGLVGLTLRVAVLPALTRVKDALAPVLSQARWQRGYCPLCGSRPLLGEFRGLEQTRYLRCGWCAAEWQVDRLFCPGCGNQDHRTLGYLHVEGEEAQRRATTCDVCHGYVKMVTTLLPLSVPQLLVADLATLHLDLIAADRGYFVPA